MQWFMLSVDVSCVGTKQPWYLLGNLLLLGLVLCLVGSDFVQPMRFAKLWSEYVAHRKHFMRSLLLDFGYEKVETTIIYFVQVLAPWYCSRQ